MLSEYQLNLVWEGLLGAEIRAAYFADLSHRLVRLQKWLTLGSLLLSSGAGVSLLYTALPPRYAWVRPTLAFLAAGLGLWSLVAKNERGSIDAANLHARWAELALEYEGIWQDTTQEDVQEKLSKLRTRELDLSQSSTSLPDNDGMMKKAQALVEMHRTEKHTLPA